MCLASERPSRRILFSFLETYPFGCDPKKAEPPKRHKTHLYFFVCVLFLCLLMVLPQSQSGQSFPATELLLCFLCNMSNLTRGMHVVWLWLISVWDYRRRSALVWHGVSSHEFSDICFTMGKVSKGEDNSCQMTAQTDKVMENTPSRGKQLWLPWCITWWPT